MKFIDLQKQYQIIQPHIDSAIHAVLQHGQFVMGPEVREVEAKLAEFVDVQHCIATASGTVALQVALMALNIGSGDEVITTPFSFFGTVEVIKLLNAKPVFVDIEPNTYNLDASKLEAAITSRTKAILPVSLYGQCADYNTINAIAAKHKIPVIEDAAQSFGATYKGRHSCGLTTIATTSFFPSKPLGCYGDGGACFTNDAYLAEKMRMLMHHGERTRYQHELIGINGRFDSIQAAVLLAKLEHQFVDEIKKRQQCALWYNHYLDSTIHKPCILSDNLSVYAQYTVEVDQRDVVQAELKAQGIPTTVHYPQPLHKQPVLEAEFHQQSFPIAERAADRVLSLPFHPYLTEALVIRVAEALNQIAVSSTAAAI